MKKNIIIAIDGPCGVGKGTIAKELEKRLNLLNIDTGAMYRCVALYALENNNCKLKININNEEYIIETNYKLIFSYDFDNLEDVEIKIEVLSGTLSLDSFTYF